MKKRVFKVLNFFAFNLLFFALYLNFVHKDKNVQEAMQVANKTSYNTTVLTENSKEVMDKEAANIRVKGSSVNSDKIQQSVLKLSFN